MGEWEALQQRCLQCRACALSQTRTNVVFGMGAPNAEVLFVGEAPGASEDEQGLPFVGKAGALLDDMLKMIGLSRADVFITNSVKCRPPENRDPLNVESYEPDVFSLLRLCDMHNIPIATNLATAEVLIHGLDRGDLDWRDIVNPK